MLIKKLLNMADQNTGLKRGLEVTALALSVFMGTINLGIFLWKGGALVSEFETLKREVQALKEKGTPQFVSHERVDDLRETRTNERLVRVETIVALIPSFDGKLAVIDTKLDDLKSQLDEHEKRTNKP